MQYISKLLTSALQIWLRSQLDLVEDLQLKIIGGDRQILRGYIPEVFLAASHAVYQGLHLGKVQLQCENIRINLGQVIKGKPLRLLEPIPVTGQLQLQESDLAASILSPLLSGALTDLFAILLATDGNTNLSDTLKDGQLIWQEVTIDTDYLSLKGTLTDPEGNQIRVLLRSGLKRASAHQLHLYPLAIKTSPELPGISLEEYLIDLGSEVELEEISLKPRQLFCRGGIKVLP